MSEAIAFPQPNAAILARRDEIVAGLAELVPPERLVHEPSELAPFETDALTAYRRVPLAVVLPATTAAGRGRAEILPPAGRQGRAARRRHLAVRRRHPAGGRRRARRSSKMNRILDVDYADRTARVQAGVTNLAISDAVVGRRLLLCARSVARSSPAPSAAISA